MPNRNKYDIMSSDDEHIIVKETPVHLTDEKIRTILNRTYEYAQDDMNQMRIYNCYGYCFSISGTVFLTFLTASFKEVFGMKASTITVIAKTVLILSLIAGILLLIWKLNSKGKNDKKCRDIAVDNVFSKYITCGHKERDSITDS